MLLQKQKDTRFVIVICFITILFINKTHTMWNKDLIITKNTECTDPYIISEVEKKIFGPNGPKIATEFVDQLPKDKYDITCYWDYNPLHARVTWHSFEKEVRANITKQLASLQEEYKTINLSPININDDNTVYTLNAYERMLQISKTISKFTEEKYALINHIIETFLVPDLKTHIVKHCPHHRERISLYNMGLLFQWSIPETYKYNSLVKEIFGFDTLYKQNWIRFTQTTPKQPLYFDPLYAPDGSKNLSISFRILKAKKTCLPNCLRGIKQSKISSMDIVLAKSVKELTEKEMNLYEFKRSNKMIAKKVWQYDFGFLYSNRFNWYVEKPKPKWNQLYKEKDKKDYHRYDQTLLEQNYYLDDFYKEKLTNIIKLYCILKQPLENNRIDLNKKIMEQMPETNQKYIDIIDIVIPRLRKEISERHIYKEAKLAIDGFCVGSYKYRKDNINSVANMIYTKKVTEEVLPYLTQEIDYLTVFRDSSAESPDNAAFICADWFKQQQ